MDTQLRILCSLLLIFILLFEHGLSFKFKLVHNNDMHARYDPMTGSSEKCPKGDDEKGLCFGGFARVASAVAKARAAGTTIYLNAGDTFQGTPWYTHYKGELAAELMNLLGPDAMCLGNHEFDDNVDGLVPFLTKVTFPVVCCNLDLRKTPKLQNIKSLVHTTVIEKFEKKIGIIGYLTPETKNLVQQNTVAYYNEIPSINAEAKKLMNKGINIIIALGHSGYSVDQEIARSCPDVDVVVGGHTHTFLYTGKPPTQDKSEGNYPTVVTKANGRQVPVLQAYAYTKFLGEVDLEFDNGGHLVKFKGTPVLLDSSVTHEPTIKSLLDQKRKPIDDLEGQVVGTTKVMLDGNRTKCRKEECNFGNFIADAFVYGRVIEDQGGLYWTDAAISVMNGGGIRASVDPGLDGSVTGADVATVLPFGNTLSVSRIRGKQLVKALEHSASLRNTDKDGGFLQVSGIRAVINFNHPKGKRITSIYVLCADCKIPHYQALNRDKYYWVIVPTFVMNGGDGHKHFKDPRDPQATTMQLIDRDVLTKYFQEHKVIYPKLESRINIVEKKRKSCAAFPTQTLLVPIVFITLYIF